MTASTTPTSSDKTDYSAVRADIVALMQAARRTAARSINAVMTATYWAIGRRIVEFEQGGQERAAYGEAMIKRLGEDLNRQFGRGFGSRNLAQMPSAKSAVAEDLQTAFEHSPPPRTIS